MDLSRVTPDVAGLQALSHPTRLRILGLLRSEGSATASSLATRLGMNSGATSYHLRHLAKHGFIEDDAERGNGRERWWRAAHQSTRTTSDPRSPQERDALDAFAQAIAVVHTEQLQRAVEEFGLLPEAWRSTTTTSDWGLSLTPARARALLAALEQVVEETEEDADDAEAGSFVVQLHTFPRPGTVTPQGSGS